MDLLAFYISSAIILIILFVLIKKIIQNKHLPKSSKFLWIFIVLAFPLVGWIVYIVYESNLKKENKQ